MGTDGSTETCVVTPDDCSLGDADPVCGACEVSVSVGLLEVSVTVLGAVSVGDALACVDSCVDPVAVAVPVVPPDGTPFRPSPT